MAETKTSNSYWKKQLRETLNPLANSLARRIAVLGIGNELNGDDSAGNWVARNLRAKLDDRSDRLVMDCGAIPENATGTLRRFQPDLILMVDAADMGEQAGTIRIVELDEVRGFSASSHTLPLSVLASYLEKEFHCKTVLLGIQPQSLEFGSELTLKVKKAVNEVKKEIFRILA